MVLSYDKYTGTHNFCNSCHRWFVGLPPSEVIHQEFATIVWCEQMHDKQFRKCGFTQLDRNWFEKGNFTELRKKHWQVLKQSKSGRLSKVNRIKIPLHLSWSVGFTVQQLKIYPSFCRSSVPFLLLQLHPFCSCYLFMQCNRLPSVLPHHREKSEEAGVTKRNIIFQLQL